MATKNYSLPGMDVEVQDGGLNVNSEIMSKILIISPTEKDHTVSNNIYDPIFISSSKNFDSSSVLGSYSHTNPLARAYNQISTITSEAVSAIPMPSNAVVYGDEDEDDTLLEKKIRAFEFLHNLFGSVKNNTTFNAIVMKNLYEDHYKFKIPCIDLGYFASGNISSELNGKWLCVQEDQIHKDKEKIEAHEVTINEKTYNITPRSFVYIGSTGAVEKAVLADVNDEQFYSVYLGATFYSYKGQGDLTDSEFSLYDLVAGFCHITTVTNKQCLAYMSVKPSIEYDIVSTKLWVKSLPEIKENGYLQVCATTPGIFQLGNTAYADTIEAAYCGLVETLDSNQSTTNKSILGLKKLAGTLSSSQCSDLAIKNYVTMRFRNGGFVVCDGITSAGNDSDFTRLTTIRITNELIENVRLCGEPYIGEPNTTASRNALQAQLKEVLAQMQSVGKITSFIDPKVICSTEDIINGDLKIAIAFFPVFEVRRINLVIALRQIV